MAARYWVGGSATWDNLALLKWSTTSGGVGGAAVPTTSDTVFFDAASGASTVTIGSGIATCSTLTMTGFTGTLAFGTNNITIASGSATIYTGATTFSVTGTPVINCTYSGSSGTRSINPAIVTEANSISFNISAGSDIVAFGNQSGIKNLNFTGFSGTFNGGSNTRTIYGNLTLSTGMTLSAGANTTNFGATSGTQQITSNGKAMDFPITFAGTATYQLADALTSGSARTMTLTSGTLDLNNKTLTVGAFNTSNSNVRSIGFGTTGNITLTGTSGTLWTVATITNFGLTGTPTVNLTDTGAGTTRTVTHTGGIASQAISVYVKAGGATSTVSLGSTAAVFKTIDLTGFSGTFANSTIYMTGDLVVPAGVTITSTANAINFIGTTTQNITTNGTLMDLPLTFGRAITTTAATGNGTTATLTFASTTVFPSVGQQIYVHGVTPSGYNGLYTVTASTATTVSYANATTGAQTVAGAIDFYGTVQLVDALTMGSTRQLGLTSGIFNSNAKSVTCGTYNANNGNVKTLTITNSTFTITNGTISSGFFSSSTNSTWNLTGSNIVFTTASVAQFYGGSATYPQVTMGGSGQLVLGSSGASITITTLANTVQPCTVSILSTANNTTVTNFNLNGTTGNLVTFNSSVAGTAKTLTKSSGTVNALYLNIQDSTATGGATFYANSSNDLGNNTGWNIYNNNFLMV